MGGRADGRRETLFSHKLLSAGNKKLTVNISMVLRNKYSSRAATKISERERGRWKMLPLCNIDLAAGVGCRVTSHREKEKERKREYAKARALVPALHVLREKMMTILQ